MRMPIALARRAICLVPPSLRQPDDPQAGEDRVVRDIGGLCRVIGPEYVLPKLRTRKISFPPLFGTTNEAGAERRTSRADIRPPAPPRG